MNSHLPVCYGISALQQSRTASVTEEAHANQINSTTSQPNDSTYIHYDDDDDYPETFTENNTGQDVESSGYSSGRVYPIKCYALYDFQVILIGTKCKWVLQRKKKNV